MANSLSSPKIHKSSETEVIKNVTIGFIPVMVKSKLCALTKIKPETALELNECPYDQGGYFVINGCEKVIVGQEKLAYNDIFMFNTKMET